jgi:hypothetical protein
MEASLFEGLDVPGERESVLTAGKYMDRVPAQKGLSLAFGGDHVFASCEDDPTWCDDTA